MGQLKDPAVYDKQLVNLGRLLQTLREEEDVDVLIETTLNYFQTDFDYSLIWLGLYDRIDHRIFGRGGVTPAGDIPLLRQRLIPSPGDILEQVVIQQRPVGIPDLRSETRAGEWRKVARKFNIQGTIVFPIRYQDRCFGVALLGTDSWGIAPQSEEKARLSMVLGGLGAALNKIELDWQRQQTKHPDKPLLKLLARLRSLPTLSKRLEAIVEETHRFIAPSRTNIYWFEPDGRYFWKRTSSRQANASLGNTKQASAGITVQEASSFYQALIADQLVSVGEAQSTLKADTTQQLMQRIRARSLLAAPILLEDQILGFLSAEGSEARIWEEAEKKYIRGAAQLLALLSPLETVETTIQQNSLDRSLTVELTRAIFSDEDWKLTLQTCADQLCSQLEAERFLVLLYDSDQDTFEIYYQTQPNRRRPVPSSLGQINELDRQMLEQSTDAISIENLDDDLRLLNWRDRFLEVGVRSLLFCHTAIGHPLEAILVVAHETARTWTQPERELVRVVSQQIGLILHQWQLQQQTDQQKKLYQTLQWGLSAIQQNLQIDQVERSALQHIGQLLQAPLSAMITWLPGRQAGRILPVVTGDHQFTVNAEAVVPVYTDTLLQWVLQTEGILSLSMDDLPPETRNWLSGPGIGQILAMALRTSSNHEPMGAILVADHLGRQWSERSLDMLEALVSQLAWSRRHLMLTETLYSQRENLKQLNWYKNRRLEEICRTVNASMRRLSEMGQPKDRTARGQKEILRGMHYQQILRQLGNALTSFEQLLKEEQWQLRNHYETVPLATLLKRSLERIDRLAKQRRLWYQVHNDANLNIGGDIVKIEQVLHEILTSACHRSQEDGRIDIWCRPVDEQWLELSITDYGTIDPRLMSELENGRVFDLMAPSALDRPPGLHLFICQTLMQQIGGELNFSQLEDGRVLSQMVVPIATGIPLEQSRRRRVKVNSRHIS